MVRYGASEQTNLDARHDDCVYTISIALNRVGVDFHGGASHFIPYECKVSETRKGWSLIHPGRLTHYHEEMPVTKGARYTLISLIDA